MRRFWPLLFAVAGVVTCDAPTFVARRASIAVSPVFPKLSLSGFTGLTVDSVRLTVTRLPNTVIRRGTYPFNVDSSQITTSLTVELRSAQEQLQVLVEFLSGSQIVFSGTQMVDVVAGAPAQRVALPVTYQGPGTSIKTIAIAPRDTGATFGQGVQYVVTATDSANNPVTQFYVSWSTSGTNAISGDGYLHMGTTRGQAWVFASTPTGIKDSTRVWTVPLATQLQVVSGSSQSAAAGSVLAQPLVVKVLAADNLPVVGVPVVFAVTAGGGHLAAATVATDSLGLASTVATLGPTVGAQTFTATVTGIAPVTFNATGTSGIPASIAISAGNNQVAATGANVATAPAVVVLDASSTPVAGAVVTFAVASGGGSVTGASATTNGSGVATVGSWKLGASPGANTLTATVASLGPVTFTATAVTPGLPASVAINAGNGQSANAGAAVAVAPSVLVRDGLSTPVSGVSVTFAVASGGGAVTGATTTTNASGIATVGSWTLGATPGGNSLTATVSGLTPATFTATGISTTPTLTIVLPGGTISVGTVGVPIKLSAPAPAGGVSVAVTSDSTQYVTVAQPGTVAFAQGDSVKTINITGVTYGLSFLHASATGYISATVPVAVTPNVIVLQQNVVVAVGSTANVTIQLIPAAPVGGLTVTLASTDTTKVKPTTNSMTFSAGQFQGLFGVTGIASGIAGITATAPGYATGGTVVTAGSAGQPAALVKFAGDSQIVATGTTLPVAPAVKVTDIFGTAVANASVTFSVVAGGGSVTGASATTNAGGVATVGSWTLGATPGANSLMATVAGLPPVVFGATATAPLVIDSVVIAPRAVSLNALGQTLQLTAQAWRSGAPVSGTFTWLSRTTANAIVDLTGKVTSVANGTSYVVVTEAGSGKKDSSLVTVAQTLASINVTPGTRSIYLTRNFAFTAQAVDGLGHPLPSNPAFTWSSTAPAVATVDTAGHVTAVGLGNAQIRATASTVIGIANVAVITPITRIAVVVDTVGATKTDTFSLASLGIFRRYRAIAHDTLDAVMTGVTFSWVSTNGAVAQLQSFNGDTASVVSAANGVTQINATAQGFTSNPGAFLTVSQVLASIALAPDVSNPTATIAVTGTVHVSARGKDANNFFISGGTFRYASATTAVATVDSITGTVTGVANGTSNITATSGAITSNAVTVTVGGAVPSIISFGRDTVSVGRGSSAQIPILLSKPDTAPLTVNLTAPAFAHWSAASVVIPTGQTSINATLVGDSAGTTLVTATDGSGHGYAAGHAVAKVTANMSFASGGYAINATDIVTTQVVLTDPSPAGGTYVTFSYGTPGIASVSPDPAFIPAGQLAVNVQIRALAGGATTITPVASGVNGVATNFTAYAPILTPSNTFIRLGQGQYEPNTYVYTPTYTNLPVPVTITSSDTNVVTVTPAVTIAGGSYYAYFSVVSKNPGSVTLAFSAPGWSERYGVSVQVTSPALGICCGNSNLFTTSPPQGVTVYSEDSLRSAHYRVNSLLVHLRSSDTTIIKVDSVVTIQPGLYYNNSGQIRMGGGAGTAWVVATASGHAPDSAQYTVAGPPLNFSWGGTPLLGAGQYEPNVYVYTPNYLTAPLIVTLTSSDSTLVSVPHTVTIPTNSYYAYFNVSGVAPGSVTIQASATGYAGVTGSYRVSSPRLYGYGAGSMNNFGPGTGFTVYSTDSLGSAHYRLAPLTVSVISTDTTKVRVDSASVTIPAGLYYNNAARITPVDTGTAKIIFSAPGHPALDTLTSTVLTPTIRFAYRNIMLGRRQRFGTSQYVYTPDYRPSALPVTIVQKHNTVDTLATAGLTIPQNSYYVYEGDVFGIGFGVDTLIVSAAGYYPDTSYVTVTTPRLTNGGMPGSVTTTNPPFNVTVYATDSVGSGHYVMDTVVVSAVSSDSTVVQPANRSFRILKDAYYAQPQVFITGPGTASITYTDSANTGYQPTTTGTVTVTGPSLAIANSTTMLGMRQTGGINSAYVYAPNNVATPLTVNLLSTDPRVVTVPASVVIPAGSYYAYFPITALDTVGTIQIQATATGYSGANTSVQVTPPRFTIGTGTSINTTSVPQTITVYATDANGTGHYTTEDVAVTLLSSAPNVAAIDSTVVTIVASGSTYYTQAARWSPVQVGTAQITASDPRATLYHYSTGAINVQVNTPSASLQNLPGALGIGQYQDYAYAQSQDYMAAPTTVQLSHTGTARTGTYVNLTNTPTSSLTIPAGNYYQYFRIAGLVAGTDTLVASIASPVHNPATAYTLVSLGRVDPIGSWPSTILAGDSVLVTLYARDVNQTVHYVVAATAFNFTAVSNIEFWSGGANSSNITATGVTIPADAQYVQFYLKGKTAGTGSVTITNANYTSYTVTVTVQ